jgi:glucose/mannose-6-phosphate isomerase
MLTQKEIERYDNSGMFDVISNFSNQIQEAQFIGNGIQVSDDQKNVKNIIISGLGGSAIGGDLLRSALWYETGIPVYVNRNYRLPAFADENTLVIISSYSGNTEESLSAYDEAKKKKCKMVCISSGGNLSILAENDKLLLIKTPKGYQPRAALAYSFFPLLILMTKLGFIGDKSTDITSIIKRVSQRINSYKIPDESLNNALKIASYLQGTIPILYSSSDLLDIVNLRWRGQLNENAKTLAFGNYLPEMNHNEIVGWQENPALLKYYSIIAFRDKDDHPQILKRMDITLEITAPQSALLVELEGEGNSRLERIFDLIYLGDWVSFYLAMLYKIDPTPVEKINYLKNKLSES